MQTPLRDQLQPPSLHQMRISKTVAKPISSRQRKYRKLHDFLFAFLLKQRKAIKSTIGKENGGAIILFEPTETCKEVSKRTVLEYALSIAAILAVFSDKNSDMAARILEKVLDSEPYKSVKNLLDENCFSFSTASQVMSVLSLESGSFFSIMNFQMEPEHTRWRSKMQLMLLY